MNRVLARSAIGNNANAFLKSKTTYNSAAYGSLTNAKTIGSINQNSNNTSNSNSASAVSFSSSSSSSVSSSVSSRFSFSFQSFTFNSKHRAISTIPRYFSSSSSASSGTSASSSASSSGVILSATDKPNKNEVDEFRDELFVETNKPYSSATDTDMSFTEKLIRKVLFVKNETLDDFVNDVATDYPEVDSPVRVDWVDESGNAHVAYAKVLPDVNTMIRSPFNVGNDFEVHPAPQPTLTINFMDSEGKRHAVKAWEGESLLDVCKREQLPMPGSCGGGGDHEDELGEGALCAFCHCYVASEYLDKLEPVTLVEKYTLAPGEFGVKDFSKNSRLGCQIILNKSLDGISVYIPSYPDHDLV